MVSRILVAVLGTGAVLMLDAPFVPLLGVKVACGLFAVGVNLWCLGVRSLAMRER